MRVTQKMLFSNFMLDINRNRGKMAELQSDLSSGRSVRFPSQGPVAFQRSRLIEEDIHKEEQFQDNIDSGLRQGRLAQQSMDEIVDRLIDIKSVVVKGASSSLNVEDRTTLANEVSGIRDSLISSLNVSYGDRYLFAGTNSAQRPFEKDTTQPGGVANHSNGTAPKTLVADGVSVEMSITGQELTATGAGDLFEIVDNIEQALRSNDSTTLNNLLNDSDELVKHVTDLNSRLGSNINRMEFMFEQYESTRITKQADISNLVDTDYAQAFSDLQRTQVAFESAMAVHSSMFSHTLLDYL